MGETATSHGGASWEGGRVWAFRFTAQQEFKEDPRPKVLQPTPPMSTQQSSRNYKSTDISCKTYTDTYIEKDVHFIHIKHTRAHVYVCIYIHIHVETPN